MAQVVIENPIINSAFEEPKRHFKFSDEGITNEIVDERRISAYFIPIPPPKKKGKQLAFDTEWTRERIKPNEEINRIRNKVSIWRKGNYAGVTKTTRRLLEYWTNPERERKLFFCQVEALETAIYITEVANKYGDSWIENNLRRYNEDANPEIFRIAFKMATGSGKTVVMAMLIAWHVLNKLANPQDARFSDAFLIVTPGITIKDRLRVLLPNDPQNYYRQRDVLPAEWMEELGKAKIIITNFHAFKQRELVEAGKLTKSILNKGETSAFTETPDQMVRRVCRELGNKKNIIVINDEAHHCYRRRIEEEDVKLSGDERKEAEKREEEARVWISGLEAVKRKIGIRAIYDLSATPFFLRGSGYPEGTLFPWVVSDFSLIDAIECGIVKVPRVPVADDAMTSELPTYRNIWVHIRDHLPKKGRGTKDESGGDRKLPVELEGALHSLYGNYEKYYKKWEQNTEARARGQTPPVFIVVCNNTNVSKLVYDYISGWEKPLGENTRVVVPGELPIFRNHDDGGNWLFYPNTILIDSEQLESGEAMSKEFKKAAALAIEEFKHEYRIRFPGRDAEKLTDEDLLREVMNTIGKLGKLGENVKCVVSVSMLSEGWDANTVTHIMGVRAFGTQLLCEQVVGRGLRRTNYVPNDKGMFTPEYAEVYGVPFSFIPCSGSATDPKPGPMPTRVRALEERIACETTFPRVTGYRYDLPGERLTCRFNEDSKLALSTADIPTRTENAPIIGETVVHTLWGLKERREQEVVFLLAKFVLESYFRDDEGNVKQWLFPQLLTITKHWLDKCVTLKDNTFIQMLLLKELGHNAADHIYKSIVASEPGPKYLKPILRTYDYIGSTRYVDFDTTRSVYATDPAKCHISHVVADTESWEQKMAQALEEMNEVVCYAKNQNLGFTIPYTLNGEERGYIPDFLVRIRDGTDSTLNLIVEVSGWKLKDKEAKVSTARNLWVPAVNNHGGFGRWAFLEISDPWDAKNTIRAALQKGDSEKRDSSLRSA
jgi:type III restriction enzyme